MLLLLFHCVGCACVVVVVGFHVVGVEVDVVDDVVAVVCVVVVACCCC